MLACLIRGEVPMNDARLIKAIPMSRLRLIRGDANKPPAVGDLGETDQWWSTGLLRRQMVLVYFVSADGDTEWEAQAYESEIEELEGT
jgi:hypothetical protein